MGILIYKDEQQEGPFDLETIQQAMEEGRVTGDDYAWQEGCTDWVPLRTLLAEPPPPPSPAGHSKHLSATAGLTRDDQDAGVVARVVLEVQESLAPGEEIQYIGVQKKPLGATAPDAVLLTNKRLMFVRTKSMDIEEHGWDKVSNVCVSEQLLTATVTCTLSGGRHVAVGSLPKKQARKIESFSQEIEAKQAWWEQRGW